MLASLSKPGLLAICGWLCATVGLPAGVICHEADGPSSFEVACESACDRPSDADPAPRADSLAPGSTDCSDTPVELEMRRPDDGRDHPAPALVFQPASLSPQPVANTPLLSLIRADDVEQPRAGPLAAHLPSVILLI